MPLGGNGRAEGEVSFSKKQVHRTFVGVCAIVDLRRRQSDLPRRKVGECPRIMGPSACPHRSATMSPAQRCLTQPVGTSSVHTLKLVNVAGPKGLLTATSAASPPRPVYTPPLPR